MRSGKWEEPLPTGGVLALTSVPSGRARVGDKKVKD